MALYEVLEQFLGADSPIAVRSYDGTRFGPDDAKATLIIESPDALRRIITRPGELGIARAYVAGDISLEGDIWELFRLQERIPSPRFTLRQTMRLLRTIGLRNLRPPAPPPEEAPGRRIGVHSIRRDAEAIAHHYDVSNRFYELVLGPSMTYSCAVFDTPESSLAEAQDAKYELISAKLGLRPGRRLLDVGCGWGGMVLHAARHHGVEAVGVTISQAQYDYACGRVQDEGLEGQVEIRLEDYREVGTRGERFDAISSIGMFEHVGLKQLGTYFDTMWGLLTPAGRMLNHAIGRPASDGPAHIDPDSFVGRYVFPDSELLELGSAVTGMQEAGFEVRHVESLREHYDRTLRAWVANLQGGWDEAVREVGEARARIWLLYMAGSADGFRAGRIQVHQTLGVRADGPSSAMPLRPTWN